VRPKAKPKAQKEKRFEEYTKKRPKPLAIGRNVKNDFGGFEVRGKSRIRLADTSRPMKHGQNLQVRAKNARRRRKGDTMEI